jgi:uncharacterized protein YlxW (UPF0749 family)
MKIHKNSKYIITASLFVIGILVGVLMAAQFKVPNRVNGPIASVQSLKDAKKILDQEHIDLTNQIASTRSTINNKQDDLKANQKISKDLVEQAQALRDVAGITAQKGSGVVITLADAQTNTPTADSIVYASDIRDVVNVLWQAGAQAISVNDQRLVVSSSIDSTTNTILVNTTSIVNPFVIKATGDSNKLKSALNDKNVLSDIKQRQKNSHLIFNIETANVVNIDGFNGGFSVGHATIIGGN